MPRMLSTQAVLLMTGVSRSTLARWRKSGHFPAPLRLGPGRVGWPETEVLEWIDNLERATGDLGS